MAVAALAAPIVAGAMGASVLTIAGLALSAAGLVTGNKNLALVGSMVGLAGGFLGGGIAGAGEAAGGLSGGASGATEAAAGTAVSEATTAAGEALQTTMTPEAVAAGADVAGNTVAQAATPEVISGAAEGGNLAAGNGPLASPAAQSEPGMVNRLLSEGGPLVQQPGPVSTPGVAAQPPGGGIVDRVMDWAKKNPVLSYGLMTTGGRMLQAGFTEDPQADRVAHLNSIELAELQRRTGNLEGIKSIRPLNIVNPNVSPFKTTPYVSPTVGMVNRRVG